MHALSIFIFFCDDKSRAEVQPGYAAAVAEHAQHLIRQISPVTTHRAGIGMARNKWLCRMLTQIKEPIVR